MNLMSAGERRLWERLERGDVPSPEEAAQHLSASRKAKRDASERRRSRPSRTAGPARPSKKATARERRREVYAAVDARSGGRCECFVLLDINAEATAATEHDHFWGRGKAPEAVENVWHLCGDCHHNKTRNFPSRLIWLQTFRDHCERHGYTAQVAKCDAAIALEIAQHPEHRRTAP